MGTVAHHVEVAIDERSLIQGRVIEPGQMGYDTARSGWNLTVEYRPSRIVVAQSAEDVAAAVQMAGKAGLGIAVMATGHGPITPAGAEALMIVTSEMTGVEVDPATRTAWVEAGTKWGAVLSAAQQHGLAPLLGSSPDVGAVGYTLGGGLGWLARKYGVSADSVRAFEVVTTDGERLHVSETEHADLFWGMRGGGGSLAIVTRMQIALHPVTTVYAGNLLYPVGMAAEILGRYCAWMPSLPEEMTSSIVLMNFPPFPMVPEPLRGKSFAIVRGCYAGDAQAGEELLKSWRSWREPAIDLFRPMPFAEASTISNDPEDPSPGVITGAWLGDLGQEVSDTLMRFTFPLDGPPPLIFTEVRHVGGASARVDPATAAYSNRDADLLLDSVAMAPTPEAAEAAKRHMQAMKTALGSHLTGRVYMNFLEVEESRARIADAFSPATYQRLRELKTRWDPENRLRYGFAIEPLSRR